MSELIVILFTSILVVALIGIFWFPIVFMLAKDAKKARQMKVYWETKWPDERTPDEKTLLRPSHVDLEEELLRPAGPPHTDKESLVRPAAHPERPRNIGNAEAAVRTSRDRE